MMDKLVIILLFNCILRSVVSQELTCPAYVCRPVNETNSTKPHGLQEFLEYSAETGWKGVWTSNEPPTYASDGFVVALSGEIKWNDLSVSMGKINESLQLEMGIENGYIAKVPENVAPQYDSVFTLTNDKGLTCSVEVKQTGFIYLKAWSFPLLYYQTLQEMFLYVDDLKFLANDKIWDKDEGIKIDAYDGLTDSITSLSLSNFFYINLEGIVYVRADAFATILVDVEQTPSPTQDPVGAAKAIPIDMDTYTLRDPIAHKKAVKTASDFIESLSVTSGMILVFLITMLMGIAAGITMMVILYFINKGRNSKHVRYSQIPVSYADNTDTETY